MKTYIKFAAFILPFSLFAFFSFANDLNLGLPMTVDSKIELHEVFHDLTYTYQLKNISPEDAEIAKEDYQFFIKKKACEDKGVNMLFERDVKLQLIYKVASQEILKFHIDKEVCNQLRQQHWVL